MSNSPAYQVYQGQIAHALFGIGTKLQEMLGDSSRSKRSELDQKVHDMIWAEPFEIQPLFGSHGKYLMDALGLRYPTPDYYRDVNRSLGLERQAAEAENRKFNPKNDPYFDLRMSFNNNIRQIYNARDRSKDMALYWNTYKFNRWVTHVDQMRVALELQGGQATDDYSDRTYTK